MPKSLPIVAVFVAGMTAALAGGALAKEGLTIALVGPQSGALAAFGDQVSGGVKTAVADLNAAGGVLGRTVELRYEDDACDPKLAVAAANRVISLGVAAVIGHVCSNASIAAAPIYAEEGVLMISPTSTAPALTDEAAERGQTTVFRVTGRDDAQGRLAGRLLAERFADQKIALVHDKSAYGAGLVQAAKAQLNALGVSETDFDTITPGERDLSALITRLKDKGVAVLYFGGYHTEAALLARQAAERGYRLQLIGADALITPEFWAITGSTGEGTMMTFPRDPRSRPAAAAVIGRLKDAGYAVEAYTLYAYAAVQAWAGAVARAGSLDAQAVARSLREDGADTVIGKLGFDARGDVRAPEFVWYRWHDGAFAAVEPR